jgi:hypothetical protein
VPFGGSETAPLKQPAVYEPMLWALSPIFADCLVVAQLFTTGDEQHSENKTNNKMSSGNLILDPGFKTSAKVSRIFLSFEGRPERPPV